MIIKRLPNPEPDIRTVPDFAGWLRQVRQECGLQQREVAETLGVSVTSVSLWETGNRRVSARVLYQYAIICGVQFLLGEGDAWFDKK